MKVVKNLSLDLKKNQYLGRVRTDLLYFIIKYTELHFMQNEFWLIYDPIKKTQSEKLSTEDAQFSLMRMKTKEINDYFIWRNDWSKWKKLKEFLTSDDSPFMSTFLNAQKPDLTNDMLVKPSINMKPVDSEVEKTVQASFSNVTLEEVKTKDVFGAGLQQFDGEQFTINQTQEKSNINFKNLDKNNAFSKTNIDDKHKIELLLIHPKGNMFRSVAKDISLSGTFSERIIPDEYHHNPFDIIVITNFINDDEYKRLTLKARIVITDASIYLEFVNLTDVQKEKLRAVLTFYVRAVQKLM